MLRSKRAMAGTTFMALIGAVMGALVFIFLIVPVISGFIGIPLGSAAEAASTAKGFSGLLAKIDLLESNANIGSVAHSMTVDGGFYLVSFNRGETQTVDKAGNKAIGPPECSGQACLCVCTEPTCTKFNVNSNKGRDCRPLQYNAIIAQAGVENNEGGTQKNAYLGNSQGYYLFVKADKGELFEVAGNFKAKRTGFVLQKSGGNLYLGKIARQ